MRILQILPELNQGGVEYCVLEIAEALTAQGDESFVLSAGGKLIPLLEQQGSTHLSFPIAKKTPIAFLKVKKLAKCIADIQPDLIHIHSRFPAWLVYFARKKIIKHMNKNIPIITTIHGLNSVSKYSKVMTEFDRIITVSQTAKQYICKHFQANPKNITVIYPGVDTQRFNLEPPKIISQETMLEKLGLTNQHNLQPLVLLVGRIANNKGQNDLFPILQALERLKANHINILIVGGGKADRINKLKDNIQKSPYKDRIFYLENHQNMPELYHYSSVVLSLSRKAESYGRTVMEALACGKPVLGYAHGGVKENLQRYFPQGLIELGNTEQMAKEILYWTQHKPELPPIHDSLENAQNQHLIYYKELIETSRHSS